MSEAEIRSYDAVVVGAGFAGMYMLYKLRSRGLSVRLLEAAKGPGGVWYWNRYPGARCDVESIEYQYGFDNELQRSWTWSERYATQPEILRYVHFVADRLEINKDADYDTRVVSAVWDAQTHNWQITTSQGWQIRSQFCIMATGHLSATRMPDIPGIDSFTGGTYHTGEWPHEGVDFTGHRVGIIGTGSSGVQSIPHIAQQASQLFVFQRTPAFSMPAGNGPLSEAEIAAAKEDFPAMREKSRYSPALSFLQPGGTGVFDQSQEEARERLESRWDKGGFAFLQSFTDTMVNPKANQFVSDFVRAKIREKVADPKIAEKLIPTDYPIGTKRPCLDSGYFETFNRPNVTLVDVRAAPIEKITPAGIVSGGQEYKVDDIIFATGFDAMTGALSKIDIRGENGLSLQEKWAAGPLTYLGLSSVGFPNLFILSGPGSPSVLANCISGAEHQVDWIVGLMDYMRARGHDTISVVPEAEQKWVDHVNETARGTLFMNTNSWYWGSNVPGKPRVFMPYINHGRYRMKCEEIAAQNYKGFATN